jgi:hypothetical protein
MIEDFNIKESMTTRHETKRSKASRVYITQQKLRNLTKVKGNNPAERSSSTGKKFISSKANQDLTTGYSSLPSLV